MRKKNNDTDEIVNYWNNKFPNSESEDCEDDDDFFDNDDVDTIFIWGIKSKDDKTNKECSLLTQNDFDIIFQHCSNTYIPNLNLAYDFQNENEEKEYIKVIFGAFTDWMISTSQDTNFKIPLDRMVMDGINLFSEFETIQELYATFKIIVNNL